VGTRIVKSVSSCSKDFGTDLYFQFCQPNSTIHGENILDNRTIWANENTTIPHDEFVCDPYFNANEAAMVQGIKGLTSGVFYDNIAASFGDSGEAISNSTKESEYNLGGQSSFGYITTDIYTSFVLLVGIFFPSCTGT